ncbi:hypothetical protein B0H11DRAFT_1908189 [Mycena galericulata]|nr:hypothetical protein B0H11DRAFT_1908189 [Mycena galericulata]
MAFVRPASVCVLLLDGVMAWFASQMQAERRVDRWDTDAKGPYRDGGTSSSTELLTRCYGCSGGHVGRENLVADWSFIRALLVLPPQCTSKSTLGEQDEFENYLEATRRAPSKDSGDPDEKAAASLTQQRVGSVKAKLTKLLVDVAPAYTAAGGQI